MNVKIIGIMSLGGVNYASFVSILYRLMFDESKLYFVDNQIAILQALPCLYQEDLLLIFEVGISMQ